ncbi:mini-chromosome maintenance complex-binding protein isoform X1 [Sphaerodactylus townsendi]|uniref:mini-chromosome maintenance complex-binding protein isoform X1 n=1 Tax=Sphaerodactylus townsendi TaxID=933632 RepID=UPI0020276699|nr:mini-chromosome maintenance complex-binding protein isoform X1 [Sphaerodactylus townsendi]
MPCVADWLNCPLSIVQGIFAQNNPDREWEEKVIEYFREKLKENNATNWVPSLNDIPLHYLKPNSLIKFRCMIQDMFDPEFYMNIYEAVDTHTKTHVMHFGKYRDIAECGLHQEIDLNSTKTVTAERQTFYCVPVPGESAWVKETYASMSQARVCPSTSYTPSRHKRSYEEDEDMELHPSKQREQHLGIRSTADIHGSGEPKRLETEASATHQMISLNCSPPLDLNFPLPGEKGPACLVKMYGNWDHFKVNDVLEVYGILSVDPVLNILNTEDRENSSSPVDSMDCMDTVEEQRVHSPPASLVPRIHVILAQKLQHINPLLPACLNEEESKSFVSSFMSELSPVRAELLGFLTHVFLGDSLAAEYIILHLISTVYARRDVLPLGKFTINLSGCPTNSVFTEHIYRIIQQLVPASYRLQMTIENMNCLQLKPHKDYTANRLVSGVLQLASNTSLVIDETLLEQGQLDTRGVHNVTALGHLITWQKVDYDFSYHQMEFPCNINVLITSEGRSLLPSDCQVHLQPQLNPPNMEEHMNSLLTAVLPSLLNKFRIYLSLLRLLDYSISDEITKAVEDDFVEMRKNDPESITADDLHRTLLIARFLSLSVGQTTLSRERWLRAKQLEALRKTRVQQQKSVNGNEL